MPIHFGLVGDLCQNRLLCQHSVLFFEYLFKGEMLRVLDIDHIDHVIVFGLQPRLYGFAAETFVEEGTFVIVEALPDYGEFIVLEHHCIYGTLKKYTFKNNTFSN